MPGSESPSGAEARSPSLQLFRKLYAFLGHRFWTTTAIILIAAISEGASLLILVPLLAVATGQTDHRWRSADAVLGDFGLASTTSKLVVATVLFGTLLVVRALFVWMREIRLAEHNQAFTDHLRIELLQAMAKAPWQRVPLSRRSDIEHTIHTDIRRIQTGSSQALGAVANLALVISQMIAAFLISWKLALISLLCLSLLAAALLPRLLAARKLGVETTLFGRGSHELLSRFLDGLKLYKAHGLEQVFVNQYAHALAQLRQRVLAFTRTVAGSTFLTTVGAAAVLGALALSGILWLGLSLTVIGVFVLIFARLARLAFSTAQGMQSYVHMLPALESLWTLQAEFSAAARAAPAPDAAPASAPPHAGGAISVSVSDLCYSAEPGTPILSNIAFTVAPGEVVAIVGPSGAGKTTIVDLLTGMVTPQSGRIALDGVAVQDAFPPALRRRIAYVPQDMVFFDGDLRHNLKALTSECDDDALWNALKQVEADRIPAVAAQGLDARMGELGQRFSGGERQRIGLARALLRKPGLLILDEALTAVDLALEQRILETLSAMRDTMTIVMITHRPSPAGTVDRILRLEHGKLHAGPP